MSMSKANRASRTALMVAGHRASGSIRYPTFCDDPFAARLIGEEGEAIARASLAHMPTMELWIALRTAYIDGIINRYTQRAEDPHTQVVLLGAGLDTRCARLARDGVAWFEVDVPASSALKQGLVSGLGDYPVHAATYVQCDFERDDFGDKLLEAGYDAAQPTIFVIEGVLYYLTEAAVRHTLTRITKIADPRALTVFDMVNKNVVERQRVKAGTSRMVDMISELGEPFLFGCNDVLPLLTECGYGYVHSRSFDEIALMYEGSYERERAFRFQTITTAGILVPEYI